MADDPDLGTPAIEQGWIARLRAHDVTAFEELFRAYFQRLAGFAYGYVRTPEIAAELVHDVLFAVWERRETWEPAGSVRSYLFRAVHNRALKYLEHERVERRWAEDFPGGEIPAVATPLELLEDSEVAAAFAGAVAGLPPRARAIYTLHREQGMSYAEIASLLGVSVKTVETQMSRSLKALRQRMAPYL